MKALKIGLGLTAVVLVCAAAFSTVSANSNATVDRITDFGCTIGYHPDMGPGAVITTDSRQHLTPSGNVVLKCHGIVPEEDRPARALKWTETLCGTNWGLADKQMKVFTPSGNVTLTCEVKADRLK